MIFYLFQSVARRFLSRFAVQARKREIRTGRTEEQRRYDASTSIQKTWRGFWGFSHFIIVRYEITRLQALIRGKLARQSYNLKLGCAIIIQASARQYLAKKAVDSKITSNAVVASAAQELRERIASKRIQFWWRIVHEWIKEKKAALTIERFFIHVREEVDLEVIRCERKKITKQQQRRKKRRESEEQMLERVWLKTVDEDRGGSRSQSAPRIRGANSTLSAADNNMQYRMPALGMHPHRMPSPRANQGKREAGYQGWPLQCLDSTSVGMQVPTDAIHVAPSADVSEVSNITNPSVFHRMGHGYPNSRHMMKPPRTERTERIDEISLGETSQGFEARQSSRMTTEDYIKKYGGGGGLKTAPNRLSSSSGQTPQHFFSDDGGAAQRNLHIVPSNGTPTAYQSQTQVMTPRSHQGSSRRKSSSGTPRKSSSGTPRSSRNSIGASSPGLPVTPRSHVSHHPQSPRVPTGNNHRGERHLSYPPPATPTRQKTLNGRGDKFHGISRLETAETQSQTTMSHTTYSKQSPRSRPEGHRVHGGPVPVMVMKTYPNFSQSLSIDEAQEVLYLGEEYGEV